VSLPGAERVLGGRYQLFREIARGGMAAVWEAHDALLDRRVAVKLLHPQYADDPEFLERFRREARAAASLSHPNIVPIYDVGQDAETRTPYIVMELIEGGNLKDLIRRSAPFSDREIRAIGAILAATLDYAHRKGLIHRDMKPQNVLLGEDRRPRLTDFGIAQAMASSGLTRTGAVMGSVHYIAPEVVRGGKALPQSDVYSLGAVLYEMATGRVPFLGETDLAVALAHVEETPAAPRALNAHIAPDLERTILRSLAKLPEQRFSSAAELAAELRNGTSPREAGAARDAGADTQRIPNVAPRPAGTAGKPVGGAAPPAGATATPTGKAVAPTGRAAMPADRGGTPASRGATPATRGARGEAVAPSPVGAFARRTARPGQRRRVGGVLPLLLALAAVLIALGAGFFGLATLSREGFAPPEPTPPPPTAQPTAAPKPAAVPTSTPLPTETATPQATATPEPSPSPVPTPSPVPPSPTPLPQPTAAPRAIAVPQLRGKTLEQAQAALQADGLTATAIGAPANIDKNVVFDQSPDVGASMPAGGAVTVRVGNGSTAIPAVTNLSRDQAVAMLQNNSFHVTPRDRRDPRIPAGVAIGTTPQAGSVLPRGSAIVLDVSSGR